MATLLCCSIGATLGFILWPSLAGAGGAADSLSTSSPYLGMFVGLAAGVLLGFAMFRVATAATFGIITGAACALLVSAGFTLAAGTTRLTAAVALAGDEPFYPEPGSGTGGDEQPTVLPRGVPYEPPLIDPDIHEPGPSPRVKAPPARVPGPFRASVKPSTPRESGLGPQGSGGPERADPGEGRVVDPLAMHPAIAQGFESTAGAARSFYAALKSEGEARWERTPAGERLWIMAAVVIGAGAGILVGLVLPTWAAATVTAFAGAAVLLPGVLWLWHALSLPGRSMLEFSALGWLVIWIAVALLGVAVQTQGLLPVGGEAEAAPAKKKSRKAKARKAAA